MYPEALNPLSHVDFLILIPEQIYQGFIENYVFAGKVATLENARYPLPNENDVFVCTSAVPSKGA